MPLHEALAYSENEQKSGEILIQQTHVRELVKIIQKLKTEIWQYRDELGQRSPLEDLNHLIKITNNALKNYYAYTFGKNIIQDHPTVINELREPIVTVSNALSHFTTVRNRLMLES